MSTKSAAELDQTVPLLQVSSGFVTAGGERARVGIVHNYMQYAPSSRRCSGHIAWACGWLNSFWGTQQILEYFGSGRFHYPLPAGTPVSHQEPAKPGLDYVGINFYGR